MKRFRISVCTAKSCCQRNSELINAAKSGQDADGSALATEQVEVATCGCLGQCYKGPNVLIEDHKEHTREIKNGMSIRQLRQEIRQLHAGKRAPAVINARKKLNDYLSGGF